MATDPKVGSVLLWGGELTFRDSNEYTYNLAVGLVKKGLKLSFYNAGGPMEKEFVRGEIPLQVESALNHTILDIFKFRRVIKELKGLAPQLLHLQNFKQFSSALKVAKSLDIPIVLTVFSIDEADFSSHPIKKWVKAIVAVHEEVRENLVNKHKIPKELIRVISPAVDLAKVGTTKEYEQNKIPVIGSMDPSEQGLRELVLAAEELAKREVEAEFLIAGKAKKRGVIEKLAREKSVLERFTFLETLTHSFSILPLIDVYVSTQSPGKFGQDLLNAMAWGKGIVALGRGVNFTLVKDGERGLLVPPQDPKALADGIEKLIQNPELRSSLGENGRELVKKNYSLEIFADEMCMLYEKVLTDMEGSMAH